jgi:hypothetical protein
MIDNDLGVVDVAPNDSTIYNLAEGLVLAGLVPGTNRNTTTTADNNRARAAIDTEFQLERDALSGQELRADNYATAKAFVRVFKKRAYLFCDKCKPLSQTRPRRPCEHYAIPFRNRTGGGDF